MILATTDITRLKICSDEHLVALHSSLPTLQCMNVTEQNTKETPEVESKISKTVKMTTQMREEEQELHVLQK